MTDTEAPDYAVTDPTEPIERTANRLLRTLRAVEARKLALIADCDAELDLIRHRRDDLVAEMQADTQRITAELHRLHDVAIEQDPTRRTWPLAWGTLGSSEQRESLRLAADAAPLLLAWARDSHPELIEVKTTERVSAAAAKRVVVIRDGQAIDPDTGEVVEGLEVVPAHRRHTITLAQPHDRPEAAF